MGKEKEKHGPGSRLKAFLPLCLDAIADIVEDTAALDAAPGRQEATDDTGDMAAEAECLRIVNAYTLHTKTETADTVKNDRLTISQPLLQDTLKLRHHTENSTF